MKPRHEIEIKLKVSNPRRIKKRLQEIGFRAAGPRRLECNTLFDFPDARLARSRQALRLRSVAGEYLLTLKGPPRTSRKYKIRPETETRVQDPAAMVEILRGLRLGEVFHYQKYRTPYTRSSEPNRHKSGALFYDETPAGNFVELEGLPEWIDRVAHEMGYEPNVYILASYVSLYRQERRSRGAAKTKCRARIRKTNNVKRPVRTERPVRRNGRKIKQESS